jgi:hypothetical protein
MPRAASRLVDPHTPDHPRPVAPIQKTAAQLRQNLLQMCCDFPDAVPVRARCAVVRLDLLEGLPQRSRIRYLLHRHRRQGDPLRVPRHRHRARGRHGLARVRHGDVPLRAVGWLGEQFELPCLLTGRGSLPSPRIAGVKAAFQRLFGTMLTIRLLPSLHHLVLILDNYRVTSAEAGRSPRVSNAELGAKPSPLRAPAGGYRDSTGHGRSSPGQHALRRFAFARFDTAPSDFHQTPFAGQPLSSVGGSLRQGPQRTITSCSAPMPGARRPASRAIVIDSRPAGYWQRSADSGEHEPRRWERSGP